MKLRSENHLVIVQAEVVSQLVDDRLADLADGLAAVAGDAEDRPAENGDLVGEHRYHVVRALRHRHPAGDAEELVGLLVESIPLLLPPPPPHSLPDLAHLSPQP